MNSLRMCVRCSRASCDQRWRETVCCWWTVILVSILIHYAFFLGACSFFVYVFYFALVCKFCFLYGSLALSSSHRNIQ